MQVGTGSRSAPCLLGYREARNETLASGQSSFHPANPTGYPDSHHWEREGPGQGWEGREGEETLSSRPPQICPTSGSGSRPSALSQQACVCRLHGVPVCLEVTVHVSPNDCVYVCGCDLEGISVSILGAVSVSLSVRPGSLPLLTAEHNPVEVVSHHLKVKTKGP